jgi:hypothetical protein
MLDDEQGFIMHGWIGQGMLCIQDLVETQIPAIAHALLEIDGYAFFQRALVVQISHGGLTAG